MIAHVAQAQLNDGTPIVLVGESFQTTFKGHVSTVCWAVWRSSNNGIQYLTIRQVYRDRFGRWGAGQVGASLPLIDGTAAASIAVAATMLQMHQVNQPHAYDETVSVDSWVQAMRR